MTNQEKLDQVLKAIDYLESTDALFKSNADLNINMTRADTLVILAGGALALREQIKIDNAIALVNQLRSQDLL